ncbi:hypothetical protein ACFX1X_025319 [Malus domestica]
MMHFLMGLNVIYSGVRSNILMMAPLPKVRQAYSLVIQDETQRQMSSGSGEKFSIVAAVQSRSNHSFNNSKNLRCEYCDKDGHTIDNGRTQKYENIIASSVIKGATLKTDADLKIEQVEEVKGAIKHSNAVSKAPATHMLHYRLPMPLLLLQTQHLSSLKHKNYSFHRTHCKDFL